MVNIDTNLCVGCGLCAADCTAYNIEVKDAKAVPKKECFLCGHCVAICPKGAVSIPDYDMTEVEPYEKETFDLKPENVLHHIKFRRSIRDYKPQKVDRAVLEQLVQAGRFTATAKNSQNCHFVFVQDELEQLKDQVWGYIDQIKAPEGERLPKEIYPYVAFNRRRKVDPNDDFLFRNAPVVLFITSDWELDAGLAAQNIETMAVSMGLGALYNGFLARITEANDDLKKWLGIEGKTIRGCMLLGYPNRQYVRTVPRKEANVVWK